MLWYTCGAIATGAFKLCSADIGVLLYCNDKVISLLESVIYLWVNTEKSWCLGKTVFAGAQSQFERPQREPDFAPEPVPQHLSLEPLLTRFFAWLLLLRGSHPLQRPASAPIEVCDPACLVIDVMEVMYDGRRELYRHQHSENSHSKACNVVQNIAKRAD